MNEGPLSSTHINESLRATLFIFLMTIIYYYKLQGKIRTHEQNVRKHLAENSMQSDIIIIIIT